MPAAPRETFFFYDYETDGIEPQRSRIVQVAGQRTDAKFKPIGPPLELLCRPPTDRLPSLHATFVHGIGPRTAAKGVEEAELADRLMAELERPGTTAVAYNGMDFDHELTRFLCWRTLREPYRWSSAPNARWDPIDTIRAVHALRPSALNIPLRADGKPSFKLEQLAPANDVLHESAHDAASDVHATIGLVRKLHDNAPRIIDWSLRLRHRNHVLAQLDPAAPKPALYVASTTPSELACTTVILPLASLPRGSPAVLAWDLRFDPTPFLQMPPEELRAAVFTKMADREPGEPRPGLMSLRANKNPFVAPIAMFTDEVQERIQLDLPTINKRAAALLSAKGLRGRALHVYDGEYPAPDDPEEALYAGFLDDSERARLQDVRRNPVDAVTRQLPWRDPRLAEMVFRFAARNHYRTATQEIRQRWRAHCRDRLFAKQQDGNSYVDAWLQEVADELGKDNDETRVELLSELKTHGEALRKWAQVE